MRPKPSTLIATATQYLLLLLLITPAHACWEQPMGLASLIEDADQAILVEVVAVEEAPMTNRLWSTAQMLRELTVSASAAVSEDLGMVLEEFLPYPPESLDSPFVVEGKVLGHFDPEGPRVGSSFRWAFTPGVVPGHRVVVFLHRLKAPLSFLGLFPSGWSDSVLVLPEHQDPTELFAVLRDGFRRKGRGEQVATTEWLERAMQTPASRRFMSPYKLVDRLPPELVAEALTRAPTGTLGDLDLLHYLRKTPGADLDLLALELTECLLQFNSLSTAQSAMRIAIERWQIPMTPRLEAALEAFGDYEQLKGMWREISAEVALPASSQSQLCSEMTIWVKGNEEAWNYMKQLAHR